MTTREILSHLRALALLLATAVGSYHYQKSAVIVPSLPGYLDSPSKREVRAAMARLQEPGPAASPAAPRLPAMGRMPRARSTP